MFDTLTPLGLVHFLVLVALLSAAVVTDIRDRRIPNRITVSGIVLGLLLGAILEGGIPASALGGVLVALLVTVPLYALGGIGAGDAKLLAAVGAFVGPGGLLAVFIYGGLAGGVLALAQAAARGDLLRLLKNTRDLLIFWVTLGIRGRRLALDDPEAHSVPYGVAIAAGAVLAILFPVSLGTMV